MVASFLSSPPPSPATPLFCGTLDAYMPKHFHEGLHKNLEDLRDNDNLNLNHKPSTDVPITGRTIIPSFWNFKIPSRKRSRVVYKKITPMEKIQNQFYNMLKFHGSPDESSEEVLLEQNMTTNFIPCNEIGLGAMMLKPDANADDDDDNDAPPAKKPSN